MDEDIDALLEAAFDKKGVSRIGPWVFAFSCFKIILMCCK